MTVPPNAVSVRVAIPAGAVDRVRDAYTKAARSARRPQRAVMRVNKIDGRVNPSG